MKTEGNEAQLPIHKRIWLARSKTGLSVEQVARKMGVSDRLIGQWEAGVSSITVGAAIRMAAALGVDPQVLMGFDEPVLASGLTLRQHYAGLAMQGLLASPSAWAEITDGNGPGEIIALAIDQADRMIFELSESEAQS